MKKKSLINFGITAVIAVTFFFLVKILLARSNSINTQQARKQWNLLTHAQKESWLNNYIENPDEEGVQLSAKMDNDIKSKLNSPSIVNYDRSPKFNIAKVVEADSGLIDIENSGSIKNSSGIRQTFYYLCTLKITPAEKKVVDVLVDIHD